MKALRTCSSRIETLGIPTIVVTCLLSGAAVFAADPSSQAAKTGAPPPQASSEPAEPLQEGAESLRGIVLVPRLEDVNRSGITGVKGVQVKGPAFLQRKELTDRLEHFLNAPLTKAALDQLQVDIIKFCREKGHPVVDVFFPEEEIKDGIVQIAVLEGKIGKINVTYNGGVWYSTNLILSSLHLHPGGVVDGPRLNSDLDWLNRNTYQSLEYFDNTFRQVNASFQQGELGQTDLKLEVQDRFPLRVFAGYDDFGIKVIGDQRYFAGFNWANAFGLDQHLNYEFIGDTSFERLREHVMSYVIPLPWQHEITLFGAYADLDPDLSLYGPVYQNFHNKGTYYQISGRYNIPLPQIGNYDQEFNAGVDYKNTDTPLIFGTAASQPLSTNDIAVLQFVVGYTGALKDRWGKTSLSIQGVYSPGDWVDHNNKAAYYDTTRDPNIDPEYFYGRAELRRETALPFNFSWYLRAAGQISDADLMPTETFGLGGYDTVRGYDERILSGDYGWLVVNELRTPRVKLWNITRQKGQFDWVQGLIFCDYGGVGLRNAPLGYSSSEQLLSVGAGVRFQIANNLSFRFDYGVELDRDYANQPAIFFRNQPVSRMNVGVELSY